MYAYVSSKEEATILFREVRGKSGDKQLGLERGGGVVRTG